MVSAVYIHIPFCQQICHYCDFNKIFFNEEIVDDYLQALEREIILTKESYEIDNDLRSIFVGGGTPTSLTTKQLEKLTTIIKSHFNFNDETEYTFEANPDYISEEKFKLLSSSGVNRLSFGVQTFNDNLLKMIGRTHRRDDVLKSINKAVKHNFTNISIDLMFGLPNQTVANFSQSLKEAFSLPIKHLSCYSLIIEPKTVFYNELNRGKLELPIEDDELAMYELLMNEAERNGFHQYEISNFSRVNYESVHNLTYWNNEEYFAFGAGAHRYVNKSRSSNVLPVNKYIKKLKDGELPVSDLIDLSIEEQMEEEMFLGLRKMSGVSIDGFKNKFKLDPLEEFSKEINKELARGFLQVEDGAIFLSKKAIPLANEVFQTFIK